MSSNVRGISLPASASGQIGPQSPNLNMDYKGFTAREVTGNATAVIRIRSGGSISGSVLEEISLSPGESTSDEYTIGRAVQVGFFLELVSGTMPVGAVFYG